MDNTNLAWIHLENLKYFLFLGATSEEQSIGQNITINLSLCISYTNTNDELKNTVDYGAVFNVLSRKIEKLKNVQLLEFLAEQLILEIETQFSNIYKIRIMIQKGYVPLQNYSGTSRIEVEKQVKILS